MRRRTKSREIALCILYESELSRQSWQELLNKYFHTYPKKESLREFAQYLISGVYTNLAKIDQIIKKYVRNWEIERMAVIDRNILRLGTFEIVFAPEIPPKVSINEAVELAKRFGDIDSPRFVNGILDKIYKNEANNKTN